MASLISDLTTPDMEEEEEMRADEIKRIVDDLHEQGLSDSEILRKLMEYLGTPISW